jgi:hypothetical protein
MAVGAYAALNQQALECPGCRRVARPGDFVFLGDSSGPGATFGCERCGTAFALENGFIRCHTRAVGSHWVISLFESLDPWRRRDEGCAIEKFFTHYLTTPDAPPTARKGRVFGRSWRDTLGL